MKDSNTKIENLLKRQEDIMGLFNEGVPLSSKPFSLNRSSEKPEYTVMHKNTPLFVVNDQKGTLKVIKENKNLLPFALRGKKNLKYTDYYRWASSRSLHVARENAKKVLNICDLSQTDQFEAARVSRLLSVEDRYWIREDESEKWENFDLRSVPLSKSIAIIALDGKHLSLQGEVFTAEITNTGSFPQCWERNEDGHLYLYKKSKNNYESEHEVLASDILEMLSMNHITYTMAPWKGDQVCRCKCMTEEYSRVTYADFEQYCYNTNIQPIQYIDEHFDQALGEMFIADYVLSNSDRHGGNWGFLYDDQGRIVSMHPLMDQNLSFDKEYKDDASFLYETNRTNKQLADLAQSKLRIDFDKVINCKELKQRFKSTNADYRVFLQKCKHMQIIGKHLLKQRSPKEATLKEL